MEKLRWPEETKTSELNHILPGRTIKLWEGNDTYHGTRGCPHSDGVARKNVHLGDEPNLCGRCDAWGTLGVRAAVREHGTRKAAEQIEENPHLPVLVEERALQILRRGVLPREEEKRREAAIEEIQKRWNAWPERLPAPDTLAIVFDEGMQPSKLHAIHTHKVAGSSAHDGMYLVHVPAEIAEELSEDNIAQTQPEDTPETFEITYRLIAETDADVLTLQEALEAARILLN